MRTSSSGLTSTKSKPITRRALGQRPQRIAQLGVAHPVGLGRDAARHQREIEDVDVDANVAASPRGHELADPLRHHAAEFATS